MLGSKRSTPTAWNFLLNPLRGEGYPQPTSRTVFESSMACSSSPGYSKGLNTLRQTFNMRSEIMRRGNSFWSTHPTRAKLELLYPIATVAEPSCCVGCSNGFEGIGDGLIECFFGSCLGVAQELLEFGPGLLDGVQVRRVGRQIEQLRTAGFDPLAYPSHFVRRQVVHHHHIAGL